MIETITDDGKNPQALVSLPSGLFDTESLLEWLLDPTTVRSLSMHPHEPKLMR